MKSIIPYTKECNFNGKVAEITSISLESETNVENGELSGNFKVSGDYKSHELSVNKEPFNFDLPFSIELGNAVDRSSVEFEITNFTYNLIDDSTMNVDIEFSVSAEELKEEILDERTPDIFENVEDDLIDPLEMIMQESLNEIEETTFIEEEISEPVDERTPEIVEATVEEVKVTEAVLEKEEIIEPEIIKEEDELRDMDDITESTIIDAIKSDEDSYITYNIHIVRDNETIESIASLYGATMDDIASYNDITSIAIGDKIVVPAIGLDE